MSKDRLYLAIPFVSFSLALGSPAQATCPVPNTLTNGQVANAAQVMDNFNAVANCTVSISGSPPAGSLAVVAGPKVVGGGDLSGDVTTSGSAQTTLAPSGVAPGCQLSVLGASTRKIG